MSEIGGVVESWPVRVDPRHAALLERITEDCDGNCCWPGIALAAMLDAVLDGLPHEEIIEAAVAAITPKDATSP